MIELFLASVAVTIGQVVHYAFAGFGFMLGVEIYGRVFKASLGLTVGKR